MKTLPYNQILLSEKVHLNNFSVSVNDSCIIQGIPNASLTPLPCEMLIRNLLNQVGFMVNTVFHKPDVTHYSEGTSSRRTLFQHTRVTVILELFIWEYSQRCQWKYFSWLWASASSSLCSSGLTPADTLYRIKEPHCLTQVCVAVCLCTYLLQLCDILCHNEGWERGEAFRDSSNVRVHPLHQPGALEVHVTVWTSENNNPC